MLSLEISFTIMKHTSMDDDRSSTENKYLKASINEITVYEKNNFVKKSSRCLITILVHIVKGLL